MGKLRDARAAGQLELFPLIAPKQKQKFDPDRTRPLPPLPPLPELEQKLADVRQEVRHLILLQLQEQNPRKREFLFDLERSARAEVKMRTDVVERVRQEQGHSPAARVRWAAAEAALEERSRCLAESSYGRG